MITRGRALPLQGLTRAGSLPTIELPIRMSISALIIDDEQLAREELKYLLDSVGGVDVVAQGTNGIEAVDLIEEFPPRPGLSGCADAGPGRLWRNQPPARTPPRAARPKDVEPLPQFVFATAYDQYAVRAFDVNAVDYLLKPFDRTRVQQAVERVRDRMAGSVAGVNGSPVRPRSSRSSTPCSKLLNRPQGASRTPQPAKLIVQAQNRLLLVDQAEICYAAIDEGVIRVVTPHFEGQSKCRTLEELLDLLGPRGFLARPSRFCGQHQPHPRSGAVVQVPATSCA